MSLRTLRHPHNKSDNLAPAQFGSKHLMMKKYFLPDLYCKQFEMIVIIWCLCAVLRLYRREKCCQTTFWMDFLLNVGAELSGCQYVWSQIVHCLISWCKFVCLSFWCHFFLFSLSNLSRCLIVRLPNCLVPNCPSTKTSPHLKKNLKIHTWHTRQYPSASPKVRTWRQPGRTRPTTLPLSLPPSPSMSPSPTMLLIAGVRGLVAASLFHTLRNCQVSSAFYPTRLVSIRPIHT